jgi:hypothetical protein
MKLCAQFALAKSRTSLMSWTINDSCFSLKSSGRCGGFGFVLAENSRANG